VAEQAATDFAVQRDVGTGEHRPEAVPEHGNQPQDGGDWPAATVIPLVVT
jgi:hypothetical protein